MNKLLKTLAFLTFAMSLSNANAGFPDDLSDVQFIEHGQVKSWTVGADLDLAINIGGQTVTLDHRPNQNSSATGRWPTIVINSTQTNANAWGVVRNKKTGVWQAGTWEYLRVGQTVKSLRSFRFGHFRSPIGNTDRSINTGDVYGFFVSGTIRAGSSLNNIAERSKFVVYEVGKGVIFTEGDVVTEPEPEPSSNVPTSVINLLLEPESNP